MGFASALLWTFFVFAASVAGDSLPHPSQDPLVRPPHPHNGSAITQELFWELEELSRIVDISYCVGTAGLGIQKPFKCASRCADKDFEDFELVTVRFTYLRIIP